MFRPKIPKPNSKVNKIENLRRKIVENRKLLQTAVIVIVAVVFLGVSGYVLFENDKKKAMDAEVAAVSVDMPGWWYKEYFGNSVCETERCAADSDPDSDRLTNSQEFYYNSNPVNPDTNENGKKDGEDVANDVDPSKQGNLTFEQSMSQDEIFGESLAFSDDIRLELSKSLNPENVVIPQPQDFELKVIDDDSEAARVTYLTTTTRIISKYFTGNQKVYISDAIASQDKDRIEDIKMRSETVALELQRTNIPAEFLVIHKYTISFFRLLPLVVEVPNDSELVDEYNVRSNAWYDATQAFMVVNDKIGVELSKIEAKYE